ncbi:hypothetical protein ABGB19_02065 [Mycobacterium sp. B14F4]|uniref:hypothetical protein n=1 Tax=Mycobacterium sp. B14F4 TaxID=3153565 RepID=UPI00325C8C5B
MGKHTPEAQQLLDELDAELARSSERAGTTLSWSAAEREHLSMVAECIDRRVHLRGRYEHCDPTDHKNLCRLSTEIRLLDSTVSRLLKNVETELPQPMSQRSAKAQRAALARWARDKGAVS